MLAERVIEWTRQWENQRIQKGHKEGHKKGRREGHKEGETALLLKQVERKYGAIDAAVRQRITTATTKQLECWAERILTAATIEEMFDDREE